MKMFSLIFYFCLIYLDSTIISFSFVYPFYYLTNDKLIFQFVKDAEVQPLLIAGGGGGASARMTSSGTPTVTSANAQGLIDPWDSLENWKALVPNNDVDAGWYYILPPFFSFLIRSFEVLICSKIRPPYFALLSILVSFLGQINQSLRIFFSGISSSCLFPSLSFALFRIKKIVQEKEDSTRYLPLYRMPDMLHLQCTISKYYFFRLG